jgi:LDH2 family malate/lactate/ureidoglycolate dehydrogenase
LAYYTVQQIKSILIPVIQKNGYSFDEAELVLDDFIESDLLGKSDYGIMNLPRLLRYDSLRPKTPVSISTNGSVTMINGGGHFAQILLPQISRILCEGTSRTGLHAAGITNVTTVTRGATMTHPLCQNGLIAIAFLFTNSAISRIPTMGRSRLGVNVISIGIPSEPFAVVYDASLTAMSLRKVRKLAESGGNPPPYPIGIDSTNRPTTNAAEIVDLIPMAGERGFGLSLAVQLIAGAMLGLVNPVEPDAYTGNNSATVLTIDPDRFGGQWKTLRNDIRVWLEDLIAESTDNFRIPGQKYSELMATKETASIDIPAQLETLFNLPL